MRQPRQKRIGRAVGSARQRGRLLVAAAAFVLAAAPALAQGWWPWNEPEEERPAPPVPNEPVYREPPEERPPPAERAAPGTPTGGWEAGTRSSICLQLEQKLVQEGRGTDPRSQLPAIESELRAADQAYRSGQDQLERMNCYEYFFFSKTLRRTRRCVDQATSVDDNKRRVAELEARRQEIVSTGGRSYRDEIVQELARNRCGASYEQQARRQRDQSNPFSSLWEEEGDDRGGGLGNYRSVPYATYRTLCVRMCDGYYFPISFSTLPNHFQRDAEACQSKCAAPAQLYYYQNPGSSVDQAVGAENNEPYTQLKTAFRYRKEYVKGCSCKVAEFKSSDPNAPPAQHGTVTTPPPAGAPAAQAPPAETAATPDTGAPASTPESAAAPPPAEELPWRTHTE